MGACAWDGPDCDYAPETASSGFGTGQSFVDGMHPALFIGAGVVALGALAAFMIPRRPRVAEALEAEPELAAVPELAYEAEAA